MKNLLKKWIFIAQFHFQDPDPDPAWQFKSGSATLVTVGRYLSAVTYPTVPGTVPTVPTYLLICPRPKVYFLTWQWFLIKTKFKNFLTGLCVIRVLVPVAVLNPAWRTISQTRARPPLIRGEESSLIVTSLSNGRRELGNSGTSRRCAKSACFSTNSAHNKVPVPGRLPYYDCPEFLHVKLPDKRILLNARGRNKKYIWPK